MKDYIRFKLQKLSDTSGEEKTKVLEEIYKELASKGYPYSQIYIMINEVIVENVTNIIKQWKNKKENNNDN